jgi:hypothetical protein
MVDVIQLKPYKSLILTKVIKEIALSTLVDQILDDLISCLDIGTAPERRILTRVDTYEEGELTIGALHYTEERPASWTSDTSVVDTINHLIVICGQRALVAIYMSESNRKSLVANKILQKGDTGLGILDLIPRNLLNAAFVQGPARTLWLSGTHRRTIIKADNKILSGLNLRFALDPLEDQTFHFTAARCVPESIFINEPVGVSPRKSQVWLGSSRNWNEFLITVKNLLNHVEKVKKPTNEPLPIVAISSTDTTEISMPYDIALMPPELLADDPSVDEETQKEVELWGYHSNFMIVESNNDYFISQVSLKNQVLGEIRFDLEIASSGQMYWDVEEVSCISGQEELLTRALKMACKRSWVKIWFESGHTVSGGEIYEVRHRDIPFKDIVWAKFQSEDESQISYDVSKEKPTPLDKIGTQDSLFDWMLNYWPNCDRSNKEPCCWLSSDDGAMEIADFIHLDVDAKPPILNLIHVKGSGNNNLNRGISVSDYEVVTGQAVKNLRHLDRVLLEEGLKNGIGKKISELVWFNRGKSTREDMIEALTSIGNNYIRRVYVLQPRLTKTMFSNARKDKKGSAYARLRQLDTLLLSAAASSKGLGVEFFIIGEDI